MLRSALEHEMRIVGEEEESKESKDGEMEVELYGSALGGVLPACWRVIAFRHWAATRRYSRERT